MSCMLARMDDINEYNLLQLHKKMHGFSSYVFMVESFHFSQVMYERLYLERHMGAAKPSSY